MINLSMAGIVNFLGGLNPIFNNRWILAISILVTFYIVSEIVVFIFEKIILKATSKTKTDVDDKIIHKVNRPISLILLLIGIMLAVNVFGLDPKITLNLNKFIITLIIIIAANIIIRIFDVVIDSWGKTFAKKTKSTVDDALIPLFHRFTRVVIYILGILYILDQWGVAIGPLLASLGIAGLAIAFALQNTLGNIFGGISMILDKTIRVGDVIKLEDGTSGKVLDVGLRSTKIRTWDNEVIILPNGKLADSRIQNIGLPSDDVRMVIDFGVAYGTKTDNVKKVVLGVIKKHKKILKDPEPAVRFMQMGDSALVFKAFCWVAKYTERFTTKEELTCQIYDALNKAKIEIPFPQRTVWMYNMGRPRKR